MAVFKFSKVYEKAYFKIIEADNFEEAKQLLKEDGSYWEEDDGGESYLIQESAFELDEDDEVVEEYTWSEY